MMLKRVCHGIQLQLERFQLPGVAKEANSLAREPRTICFTPEISRPLRIFLNPYTTKVARFKSSRINLDPRNKEDAHLRQQEVAHSN